MKGIHCGQNEEQKAAVAVLAKYEMSSKSCVPLDVSEMDDCTTSVCLHIPLGEVADIPFCEHTTSVYK